jgi:hypothetical protein
VLRLTAPSHEIEIGDLGFLHRNGDEPAAQGFAHAAAVWHHRIIGVRKRLRRIRIVVHELVLHADGLDQSDAIASHAFEVALVLERRVDPFARFAHDVHAGEFICHRDKPEPDRCQGRSVRP